MSKNIREDESFTKKVDLAKLREAYERLAAKGPDAPARFFKALYERFDRDVMIGFFFSGKDLNHIAAQQQAFVERAIGLRASYTGKAPSTAHIGLPPILPGFFDRRLVLLRETLNEFGISGEHQDAWIEFENAFRDAIVK